MSAADELDRMERAMSRIEDFYFDEDENGGEQLFKKFAERHLMHFHARINLYQEENKLEYTLAFQDFQNTFENKLEEIIISEGLTVSRFFELLKQHAGTDEDCAVFVKIIKAVSDYPAFISMMSSYCEILAKNS